MSDNQPFLDRMQPALDRVLQMTNDRAQMMAQADATATAPLASRLPAAPAAVSAPAEQGGAR